MPQSPPPRRSGRLTSGRKPTQAQQIASLTEELVQAREALRTPLADKVSAIAEFVKEYRANMDPEDGYHPKYVDGYDAATSEISAAILKQFVPEVL